VVNRTMTNAQKREMEVNTQREIESERYHSA
jgi:hypothetical protein